jgi:hypothetical protein
MNRGKSDPVGVVHICGGEEIDLKEHMFGSKLGIVDVAFIVVPRRSTEFWVVQNGYVAYKP